LPEFPSFARGKRALKSVLRTVSVASAGATPAVGTRFDVPQPPSARKIEATTQVRVNPTKPHPCNLSTIFSPPWHPIATYTANAREPQRARQEKPLLRRANSAFIYNCGHSANIVRPTQQSMRQTNGYFGQIINFSVRATISATERSESGYNPCGLNVAEFGLNVAQLSLGAIEVLSVERARVRRRATELVASANCSAWPARLLRSNPPPRAHR